MLDVLASPRSRAGVVSGLLIAMLFRWVGAPRRSMQLLVVAVALAACGRSSELNWTEDARLPDGGVLTLRRWVEFEGGSSHLGDPSTESRQSFEFQNPETGELIKWQNDMEKGVLRTLAIWLERDQPLLLTKPAYGGDSRKYNCPNPPYLLYQYARGQWLPKPLDQIQIKRVRANLTFTPLEAREDIEQSKRHLTADATSNSFTYLGGVRKTPYIIQFEGMPKQTFSDGNCELGRNYTTLVVVEGK